MRERVEERYRDFLATKLDLIEPGLALVDTELLLPNDDGAKGFVDIVARDRFGVLVLIELKRSDAAARSAMHELFKYVALVRERHGLARHQFRCILLSTVWHELLVPFSELAQTASFGLTGRKLLIDTAGDPVATEIVEPIAAQDALAICPKHEILLYLDARDRAIEAAKLEAALTAQGVTDFFFMHLDHDGADERVIAPFGLYVVLGEFSDSLRYRVQQEQLDEWGPDAEVDEADLLDATDWGHEEEVFVRVNRDVRPPQMEIGYPDKLRMVLDSWSCVEFSRSGRFRSAVIWTEQNLIAAALAQDGPHASMFSNQVSTANRNACTRLLANVAGMLLGAGSWERRIPRLLRILADDASIESLSVNIFSPADVLWGLAALAKGRADYLPQFEIVAQQASGGMRIFTGSLAWDTTTRLSPTISIESVIGDEALYYHASRQFGAQWEDEARYCAFHGLRYAIYEADPQGAVPRLWRVGIGRDGLCRSRIEPADLRAESVFAFLDSNAEYLQRLSGDLTKPVMNPGF